MPTSVARRRPRPGMTVTHRSRQNRPMPMNALAVRRGRFGDLQLRPVREHAVEPVTGEEPGPRD